MDVAGAKVDLSTRDGEIVLFFFCDCMNDLESRECDRCTELQDSDKAISVPSLWRITLGD